MATAKLLADELAAKLRARPPANDDHATPPAEAGAGCSLTAPTGGRRTQHAEPPAQADTVATVAAPAGGRRSHKLTLALAMLAPKETDDGQAVPR